MKFIGIICLILSLIVVSLAQTIGNSVFYAEVQLTNKNYGSGATFPCNVWYSASLQKMRVDYYNNVGTLFMSVYYHYDTDSLYQNCNGVCSRATMNTDIPLFSGTVGVNFGAQSTSCPSDYPGPSACATPCYTHLTSPTQPQGIYSLSFNDTSKTVMCLARFAAQSGFTYGPEWRIKKLINVSPYSGTFGSLRPDVSTTYDVPNVASCPQPSCFAVLDIAFVIDESGSIDATEYSLLQNFIGQMIAKFTFGPDKIRAGIGYFSGFDNCVYNQTSNTNINYACSGGCSSCGGLYNNLTPTSLISNKATFDALYKAHPRQAGYTCITCGMDMGTQILNIAPKANVQKVMIFMTDGFQNRVTGTLAKVAKIAYDNQIITYAIGVDGYDQSQLLQITTIDKIYTSSTFAELNKIDITSKLCAALPNIETCDFCSGLCSCQTTCNCPDCNDFNACTIDNCDIRSTTNGGTGGACLYPPRTDCVDGNLCTVDRCLPASGCDFTQVTPKLPTQIDTYCNRYICSPTSGYVKTDIGPTLCTSTDNCIVAYCNPTNSSTGGLTGSCSYINKNVVPAGTSVTYTNSAGSTLSVAGCAKPASAAPCQQYSCNSQGNCVVDNSACVCLTAANCNDQNGCTNDVCNTTLNICVNTPIDCFNIASNGNCVRSVTPLTATNAAGLNFYNNGAQAITTATLMPSPLTGVSRTCDELACYAGKRSTYNCESTGDYSYTCKRQVLPCTSVGCVDSICTSLGSWSALGQLNTDCSTTRTVTCNDNNLCTQDNCNGAWTGSTCSIKAPPSCEVVTGTYGNRCSFPFNGTCNDNNICTYNLCNTTTGCNNPNAPFPASNLCWIWGCSNSNNGNFTTANSTACTANLDKCIIRYCNSTGSGSCIDLNKRTIPIGTIQYYVDADKVLKSVSGCQRFVPGSCITYGCDALTGLCSTNTSGCGCLNDSACNDNNGCTIDTCNNLTGVCTYVNHDCYNISSNGNCISGNSFTASNATSYSIYTVVGSYSSSVQNDPFVPGNYDCDKLACFNGERSSYRCVSTGDYTKKCVRTVDATCPKGGCSDSLCKSLGTWDANGKANTDCSAKVDYTCPGDACHTAVCNTNYVFAYYQSSSLRCINTDISSTCINTDACHVKGVCTLPSGCDYSQLVPNPFGANTSCNSYTCDSNLGWIRTDVSSTSCVASNCQIKYCNAAKNCVVDPTYPSRNDFPVGTTYTYTDQNGISHNVDGCAIDPNDPLINCKTSACDSATGECVSDISQCLCFSNEACIDDNGCTIDFCDFNKTYSNQVACVHIPIDCYSELSNGKCVSINPGQTAITQNIDVGWSVYNGTAPTTYTTVDSNGLPSPSTGIDRTCAELACYAGEPSEYTCFSIAEGQHTCQRSKSTCNRNGCQDDICRVLGTWSTDAYPQMDVDCGSTFNPKCADLDSCTVDQCNTTWVPTDDPKLRCMNTPLDVPVYCNDDNFCTQDYCDGNDTTGDPCRHSLYSQRYLKKYICKTNASCTDVQCTVNKCRYNTIECLPATLCEIFVCNSTTKNICKAFPYGKYKIDKCGVCGGNGLSCVPNVPGNPKKTSIIVALAVGLSVGLCFAAAIIAILTRTGYQAYNALGSEMHGTVTNASTFQDNGDNINMSNYDK